MKTGLQNRVTFFGGIFRPFSVLPGVDVLFDMGSDWRMESISIHSPTVDLQLKYQIWIRHEFKLEEIESVEDNQMASWISAKLLPVGWKIMKAVLILLCLPVIGADLPKEANSLETFAKFAKESYEQKNGEWILSQCDTKGVPRELKAATEGFFKAFWGSGDLKVTSVETFRFADYTPTAAPGEFQGRKLRFIKKPSHWIVVKAESPKPKDGSESVTKAEIKLEFPLLETKGRWMIVGATYAK